MLTLCAACSVSRDEPVPLRVGDQVSRPPHLAQRCPQVGPDVAVEGHEGYPLVLAAASHRRDARVRHQPVRLLELLQRLPLQPAVAPGGPEDHQPRIAPLAGRPQVKGPSRMHHGGEFKTPEPGRLSDGIQGHFQPVA